MRFRKAERRSLAGKEPTGSTWGAYLSSGRRTISLNDRRSDERIPRPFEASFRQRQLLDHQASLRRRRKTTAPPSKVARTLTQDATATSGEAAYRSCGQTTAGRVSVDGVVRNRL